MYKLPLTLMPFSIYPWACIVQVLLHVVRISVPFGKDYSLSICEISVKKTFRNDKIFKAINLKIP